MATMGLLSSSILGSIFIFLGRTLGLSDTEGILKQKDNLKEKNKIGIIADLRIFIINTSKLEDYPKNEVTGKYLTRNLANFIIIFSRT